MKKIVFLVSTLFCSFEAYACSLAPATQPFKIDATLASIESVKPSFKISGLSRGKKAQHSCSGLASLSLKLTSPVTVEQGYFFEKIEGSFDKLYFSAEPVQLSKYMLEQGEYVFYYNEMTNPPINITLKITAISKSGNKSKPQFLQIKHKGDKKLILPSWSQSKE